jgi:prepilin-type N-terminal cleavage/methylation domain-containing protein
MKNTAPSQCEGFTLIELLVVVGIIVITMALAVPAVTAMKGSTDITKTAYDIRGALDAARSYAEANNTYAWVGFYEEDPTKSAGTAGVGRVVISTVASRDGTRIYASTGNLSMPASGLTQIGALMKCAGAHLDVLASTAISRPVITGSDYQVGSTTFAQRGGSQNTTTFTYPISGTVQYTFVKIIQFSPQGDATKIVDTPTPLMEIGFRPAHGNIADASSKNVVALQITGIGGLVQLYRP